MGLLNVHSELFLLNKSLIQSVFNLAIKKIYLKILSVLENVVNYCENGAVQTYVDMFCIKETFKMFTNEESMQICTKILKRIPTNSFENHKKLMTRLISEYERGMRPYVTVFQTEMQSEKVKIKNGQEA